MLKYSDMIAKLTEAQKIRILCGVGKISERDVQNLGIPAIKVGNMKHYARELYPHVTSISHAWNTALWSEVATAKATKMSDDGVGLAIAPGAKIKMSPYRKETSEDTYLASLISAAYMKAAEEVGIRGAAGGYYISEADLKWLDAVPNNRVLNEYLALPYMRASEISSCGCIVTDPRTPSEAYKDSNAYIRIAAKDKTEFFVCERAGDDNTVKLISDGVICLDASANALNAAFSRYKNLKKLMEEGKDVTLLQLEEEMKNGSAISEEAIDRALDIALDFIFGVAEQDKKDLSVQEDELSIKAVMESTVLLKNTQKLLPISKNKKILIIDGFSPVEDDVPFVDHLKEAFLEGGYEVSAEKIHVQENTTVKRRIENVVLNCNQFDVTILLLGSGYAAESQIHRTETMALSPHQLYLARRVSERAQSVLGVVFSEHSTDIDFTRSFDALMYAPLPVKHSAQALFNIVSGRYNPSGRLAYTLYAGTETALKKGAAYIQNYGLKAGPFIGYRYYDTANLRVGYPFGYGLSYSQFIYSDISVSDGSVSFTVENCSRIPGSEVAEVYLGMGDSSLIRPKKELCGFAKIFLMPSETKRVTVKIEAPKVFYNGDFVVERGKYTVYVGASVSDIRLKADCFMGDAEIDKDGEMLSDYLQSHSNILNDNYTLEANYSTMKKGFTNIIAGVVALILAIILMVFNGSTQLNSTVLGVVSGVLTLCAILLFIVDFVERSRAYAKEREIIKQQNQALFENADQIPVLSTDKMFEDQFDVVKEEATPIEQISEFDGDMDYSQYIDARFRISDAAAEFKRFAFDRGYKFERGVVENLFTSISISKLLLVNGVSGEEFNSLVLLISEYFGCSACVDNASAGNDVKKNIFQALANAAEAHEKMYFYAIDELSRDNISDWLAPLMRYIRSPKKKNHIVMADEDGKNIGYTIGHNLWGMVRLSDDQAVDMLPVETLKCAAVVDLSFAKCQVADDQILSHGYTSYQIDYMRQQVTSKYNVPEDIWKKIEKIEKYAKGYSGYSIGNKLWLDLEAHMEVLLACGVEIDEATDASLATKILPSLTASIKDKLTQEDRTVLQTIEFVFGVDSVMACAKAYIESLTPKQKDTSSVEVESPEADQPSELDVVEETVVAEEIDAAEETVMVEETDTVDETAVAEESVAETDPATVADDVKDEIASSTEEEAVVTEEEEKTEQ